MSAAEAAEIAGEEYVSREKEMYSDRGASLPGDLVPVWTL
jgi:hypothetical protein